MTNFPTGPDKAHDASLLSSLEEWLQTAAPQIGAPINLNKFSSGQSNPTYRLQTDLGEQDGRFVLRTQPAGLLLKSAHAVDREFRVMKALDKTAVPVPGMIAACDDPDVIGMKFFVMREIEGDTLFDPALASYAGADRHALFHAKIDVLAALAKLDPIALGLEGFGKPSGYIDRQLGTWTRQYHASETEPIAAMEFLLAELPNYIDEDVPGFCVIHGDFRLDNLLIRDQVKIAALIDWELSTLGPAFIDLSYWCAMLRMNAEWPIGGLGGIDRASLGIPDEAALVASFCAKTGLERPANWDALIVFQCFRFAAILQGVLKRHLDGNASADNAASVGGQAKLVAGLGEDILLGYIAKNG